MCCFQCSTRAKIAITFWHYWQKFRLPSGRLCTCRKLRIFHHLVIYSSHHHYATSKLLKSRIITLDLPVYTWAKKMMARLPVSYPPHFCMHVIRGLLTKWNMSTLRICCIFNQNKTKFGPWPQEQNDHRRFKMIFWAFEGKFWIVHNLFCCQNWPVTWKFWTQKNALL